MAHKQWRTLVLILAMLALCSVLLAACIRPGTASTSTGGSGATSAPTSGSGSGGGSCPSGTTVKTSASNFEQSCITLSKGNTLTVAQDQTSFHILDYGQWNGNTMQQTPAPAGAPQMKGLQLSGASVKIGPFTTAGTYRILCTVHPGMNLTVIVK